MNINVETPEGVACICGDVIYDVQNQIVDPIYQVLDYEPQSTGNQANVEAPGARSDQEGAQLGHVRPAAPRLARAGRAGRVLSRLVGDSVPGPEQAVDHRTVGRDRRDGRRRRTSSGCDAQPSIRGSRLPRHRGRAWHRPRHRPRPRSRGRARSASLGTISRAVRGGRRREIGEQGLAVTLDVTDLDACERAVAEVTARFGGSPFSSTRRASRPSASAPSCTTSTPGGQIVDVNLTGAYLGDARRGAGAARRGRRGRDGRERDRRRRRARGSPATAPRRRPDPADAHARARVGRPRRPGERGRARLRRDRADGAPCSRSSACATEIVDATPLGRLAKIEEVVAPALFLASDEASYITGAVLLVDGGMAA